MSEDVPTARRRTVRLVAWAAAAALLVAGVVVVLVVLPGTRVPPAMSDQAVAAGAVRLTYPDRGLPTEPTAVELPSGDQALVALVDVAESGEGVVVTLEVAVRHADGSTSEVPVEPFTVGEPQSGDGVTVTVLDAWSMPNAGHDAADVVVSADLADS